MTTDILRLSDWLAEHEVTHVAMESTGVYWKPLFNLLEGTFTVWILNAQHVKNVPGRKTDVKDAHWLADLLRHGLVQPSFVPPQEQRDLRDLTRERTNFVRQRATVVNRLQKVLEGANLKLGDVASNVAGASGRAILAAIVAGEGDAAVLAELARGKLRQKRAALEQALQGRVRAHQRFLLSEFLCQLESLDETLAHFDAQIQAACAVDEAVLDLVDGIPGFGRELAEVLVAELGTHMEQFPTVGQAAAWAGVAPGNNESAGKQRSGRTRKGNPWLRVALVQAARGRSAANRRTWRRSIGASRRAGETSGRSWRWRIPSWSLRIMGLNGANRTGNSARITLRGANPRRGPKAWPGRLNAWATK